MARITEVVDLKLEDLVIGKGQVRLRDVGKEIDELADSIAAVGLLEPIVVAPSDEAGKYEIITGQRRFLAHRVLGRDTIMSAILDQKIGETEAKVLSVTENLVRRDLNSKDLIDVCTSLYKRYGSVQAVAEETGLPGPKISDYVKYDRLIPELKEMVDKGEATMPVALRAQKAAEARGEVDPAEAREFALEMTSMSGAQQRQIVKERERNPQASSSDVIEHAKTGGKITQVVVTLSTEVHQGLKDFAREESQNMDDAAGNLITQSLSDKGFLGEAE